MESESSLSFKELSSFWIFFNSSIIIPVGFGSLILAFLIIRYPTFQSSKVQKGIKQSVDKQDEEHRVWYVGVTRARNNLYKLRAKKKLREYQL